VNGPPYEVRVLASAQKELRRLDSQAADQIAQRMQWLGEHAEVVHHHALTGNLRGLYRLRSGDYRVVYRLLREERAIVVVAIGDRREIYRKR